MSSRYRSDWLMLNLDPQMLEPRPAAVVFGAVLDTSDAAGKHKGVAAGLSARARDLPCAGDLGFCGVGRIPPGNFMLSSSRLTPGKGGHSRR